MDLTELLNQRAGRLLAYAELGTPVFADELFSV